MKKYINCILVRGKFLELGKNTMNLILSVEKCTLIKGTVYAVNNEPSVGASIKVVEINQFNKQRKILGYTYTDENGEYQFMVTPISYMIYEFTAYSPLKKWSGE